MGPILYPSINCIHLSWELFQKTDAFILIHLNENEIHKLILNEINILFDNYFKPCANHNLLRIDLYITLKHKCLKNDIIPIFHPLYKVHK